MSYENNYTVKIPVLPTIEEKTKKCEKCGEINDSKFCPECGGDMKEFINKKELTEKELLVNLLQVSDGYAFVHESSGSWDFESTMKKFSKRYPSAVFQVDVVWESGFGDEPSRDYFQNGKQQTAKTTISFSKFNSKKLK